MFRVLFDCLKHIIFMVKFFELRLVRNIWKVGNEANGHQQHWDPTFYFPPFLNFRSIFATVDS